MFRTTDCTLDVHVPVWHVLAILRSTLVRDFLQSVINISNLDEERLATQIGVPSTGVAPAGGTVLTR